MYHFNFHVIALNETRMSNDKMKLYFWEKKKTNVKAYSGVGLYISDDLTTVWIFFHLFTLEEKILE